MNETRMHAKIMEHKIAGNEQYKLETESVGHKSPGKWQ